MTNEPDESQQEWFFTFGADHTHPTTGERLGNAYVVIHGTCDSTRAAMLDLFGNRWSNQYASAESAGVNRFRLHRVALPLADVPPLHTPTAEEPSGGAAALRADVVAAVLEAIRVLRLEVAADPLSNRLSRDELLDAIEAAAVREGEQR